MLSLRFCASDVYETIAGIANPSPGGAMWPSRWLQVFVYVFLLHPAHRKSDNNYNDRDEDNDLMKKKHTLKI